MVRIWRPGLKFLSKEFGSDFFTNQFFRAPEYPIRAASNCYKNWHRYLHLKCQRLLVTLTTVANGKNLQWEKFKYLVWTPLGSRVNIYLNFCLQVHFKVSAAWYCSHYLPPVSWVAAGIVDTGGNFSTAVVDTGGKFATGVVDTSGTPSLAEMTPNAMFRGLGEEDSWKKTWS
jgi:hypothetical protein